MVSATVMTKIAILVISFFIGFGFYFVVTTDDKASKKKYLDDISSMIINFVLYIWVGKIILNIPILIKDPMAVLAFPSNSHSFYLATLLWGLHIGYKVKRNKLKFNPFLFRFMAIFLYSSFVYEFIQIVWNNEEQTWPYLTLLVILVSGLLMMEGKVSHRILTFLLVLGWSAGQWGLELVFANTTVFGYHLIHWYYLSVVIVVVLVNMLSKRKKVF
ncbi:hypothetical protein [Salinibacillus xinjiangensis]|uniref:Uncharacterized protein n=1 Tax=Salinibacillus xinjiangensis TaxID=1229268 RepID=A0A6G1X954_9BACI|nr:hypothetical protein [Salinibacillus xinjiangensis]MRG87472.1 hypothetical protein [Salinibacillus xinjiangensis]